MADTGVKFGTSVAVGGETIYVWTNPGNFTADDSNYATWTYSGDIRYFYDVRLIIGGNAAGNNYAAGLLTLTDDYHTFGNGTDKWGLTPTVDQINAADFGVFVRMQLAGGTSISKSLQLTGFSMNVPSEATIDGIVVEVKGKYTATRTSTTIYMNCARITVYYTEGAAGLAVPVVSRQYRARIT